MAYDVCLELDAGAILGEGPLWHERGRRLYWIDIIGGNIHIYDPATRIDETHAVGEYVSCVVPTNRGTFLIARKHTICEWSPGRPAKELAFAERQMRKNRFNDGKCDPAGRFWIGSMDMNEVRPDGALYVMAGDYRIRRILDGMTVSNGLDWSPGGNVMYHVDSPTRRVFAYDCDMKEGSVSNKRTAITIPEGEGYPDGITMDSEGTLWVAHWGGSKVSRWDPDGRLLDEIRVPVSRVSSCTFGGRNLDTLYITTAKYGSGKSGGGDETHAGSLFSVVTDVRGRPANRFVE